MDFKHSTLAQGWGGHCIPIDPNYLSYTIKTELGQPFRFVELAQEINNSMPQYVISRIVELLNEDCKSIKGSKILLLGVTYKANIADQRESPALPIGQLLLKAGAELEFHDPTVSEWKISEEKRLGRVNDLESSLLEADIVVLLQAHSSYENLESIQGVKLILDTRGVLGHKENIFTI